MLVEDDEDTREGLAELLRGDGYSVVSASGGRKALDHLRSGEHADVVLLDLMMPVMDGWEFRRAQLEDASIASVPVVLMTGAADSQDAAARLRASDVIVKPFDLERLASVVSRYAPTTRA